jgi:hypothetical protein
MEFEKKDKNLFKFSLIFQVEQQFVVEVVEIYYRD